jgi:hypothetical protein
MGEVTGSTPVSRFVFDREVELARWNALSKDDAGRILTAAEGVGPDFRSCWYCNGMHEHLKNRELLLCFGCGLYYMQGFPAAAVAQRSRGEPVTEENMNDFIASLNDDW